MNINYKLFKVEEKTEETIDEDTFMAYTRACSIYLVMYDYRGRKVIDSKANDSEELLDRLYKLDAAHDINICADLAIYGNAIVASVVCFEQ